MPTPCPPEFRRARQPAIRKAVVNTASGCPPAIWPTNRSKKELRASPGLPDYQDPEQSADGRVQLNMPENPDDPKVQAAMEACRDKQPQGMSRARNEPVDSAKVTAWAKCIRENGVPKFPDPEIEGSTITIRLGEIGMMPDDPKMQKASAVCQDRSPGGSLMFRD